MLSRWARASGRTLAVIAGAALAVPATAADVALLHSVAHDELVALMRMWGYEAEIAEEQSGTFVDSKTESGLLFWVTLLDCDRAFRQRCASVAFNAQFNDEVSDEYLAGWNADRWWGTASRVGDEGAPIVIWTLNLEGGVGRGALEAALGRFSSIVDGFSDYLAAYQAGGADTRGIGQADDAPAKR